MFQIPDGNIYRGDGVFIIGVFHSVIYFEVPQCYLESIADELASLVRIQFLWRFFGLLHNFFEGGSHRPGIIPQKRFSIQFARNMSWTTKMYFSPPFLEGVDV